MEIKTAEPLAVNHDVPTIEGTLQLLGQDESGIFSRIYDGRTVAAG